MPRTVSSTGLIAARTRPVRRPKPKKIELSGHSVPAPFTLRPFAGLYNPYHYGCSVLCNHPADGEAKAVVRRAKDTLSSEGRGMQLSLDREDDSHEDPDCCILALPETPNASARESALDNSLIETPNQAAAAAVTAAAKEKTSLVLDLRATSHFLQDNETLSWHALTLEPISSSRRSSELALSTGRSSLLGGKKSASSLRRQRPCQTAASSSPVRSVPIIEVSDAASTRSAPTNLGRRQDDLDDGDEYEDEEDDSALDEVGAGPGAAGSQPMRRRGKLRRKKRKCRRGSIYGQQTEVRELPEPLETQVSQCDDETIRPPVASKLDDSKQGSIDKDTLPPVKRELPPSFLPPDVIKALSRELDQETVEGEFNAKRRYALEETLRVTGGYEARAANAAASSSSLAAAAALGSWPPRPNPILQNTQNVARLFYRQSARFQLLDSRSLVGLRPLDYLSEHVHISDARRLCYGRAFNKHKDETLTGPRYLLASVLPEALHDVLGREISASEQAFIESACLEPDTERLEFRVWCGLCAFAERLLPQLPPRDLDPPAWLERADFEMLERRIAAVQLHPKLVQLLRLIRDS